MSGFNKVKIPPKSRDDTAKEAFEVFAISSVDGASVSARLQRRRQ